jgi:hypothetical protein
MKQQMMKNNINNLYSSKEKRSVSKNSSKNSSTTGSPVLKK